MDIRFETFKQNAEAQILDLTLGRNSPSYCNCCKGFPFVAVDPIGQKRCIY